jgi:DNA-binding YbaB/EbfC family protein
MFGELSQLVNLLRQAPKLKEEMERVQQRVAQMTADGDAGGGMVKVRVNGKLEVLSCALTDEAIKLGDREMLEDLIRAATNQALAKARQMVAEETLKLAGGLGLPPGMSLPGLG